MQTGDVPLRMAASEAEAWAKAPDPYHNSHDATAALEWWCNDQGSVSECAIEREGVSEWSVTVARYAKETTTGAGDAPTLSAAISLALYDALRADNG